MADRPHRAEDLALGLEGLGGAPARPGTFHLVLRPDDLAALSVRGALLLRSADLVVGADRDLRRLAPDAEHRSELAGSVGGDHVVVRVVGPEVSLTQLAKDVEHLEDEGWTVTVDPALVGPDAPDALRRWRDRLPLRDTTVLVPRTRAQASSLSMHIRSLGGEPIEAPTIEIAPGERDALRAAVRDLADGGFAALCLTSPNGVDALTDAIDEAGLDARALAAVPLVACVGPGTAGRLAARLHVTADLVPETSTTAGLAAAMPAGEGRVLLPRADIATNTLADGLRELGWDPVEVAAYRTVTPADLPAEAVKRLVEGSVDLLAFASSSTVRNFVDLIGDRPWRGAAVSIGPVTSATCRELGIEPVVEADPHDLDGLVAALCDAAEDLRAET